MAAINQQYALEAGKQSHLYNQEMWDYTNYENQVKHLEAAGLNPALLYGQGGAGGASTAGGAVGNGQGTPGQAPSGGSPQAIKSQMIEGAGMGMQLGLIQPIIHNADRRRENLSADRCGYLFIRCVCQSLYGKNTGYRGGHIKRQSSSVL